MKTRFCKIPAGGVALGIGVSGVGLQIVPDVSVTAAATEALGSYPVVVRLKTDAGDEEIQISNADALYFDRKFTSVDVLGEAGDNWLLRGFEKRHEGVHPGGQQQARTRMLQDTTEIPTDAPTLSTEGIRLRGGTMGHNFYFTGTGRNVTLWQRSADGEWVESLDPDDVIDTTEETVVFLEVRTGADRLYLQADDTGANVKIDVVERRG